MSSASSLFLMTIYKLDFLWLPYKVMIKYFLVVIWQNMKKFNSMSRPYYVCACIENFYSPFIHNNNPSCDLHFPLPSCLKLPLAASLDTVTPDSFSDCCHGNAIVVLWNLLAELKGCVRPGVEGDCGHRVPVGNLFL